MKKTPLSQALVVLLLFTACAYLGVQKPETFNEKALVAGKSVQAARDLTTVLLNAQKISSADAQNVQAQADNLRTAIDVARQIEGTDLPGATAKLDATILALNALIAYLEAKQ